ncbi:hypothetical protein HI914_00074 [Erysiphe necator]|uniref:Uncharacterized protein n=1 Tax=Uncinula necator TaxID=52586 RepID=A0A0B1NZH3_UNCNE|nr:hypothetical protein HI914_00074 [Erysiphe necator]KHJ30081.1 hypothetical protein EV44_g1840 [Erysiphe necator]
MTGAKPANCLNALGGQLKKWSSNPVTGYYRNGFCQVGPDDIGNHSVAATLSDPFLDFTASRGNNLRSIGLKAGCKWCLCAARWREAFEFAKSQSLSSNDTINNNPIVPRVNLNATNIKALDVVKLEELRGFADDA